MWSSSTILIVWFALALAISKRPFVGNRSAWKWENHPRCRPQPKNWLPICSALSPSFQLGSMEAERKKFGRVCPMHGSECLKAAEADGTNHQNNQTPA